MCWMEEILLELVEVELGAAPLLFVNVSLDLPCSCVKNMNSCVYSHYPFVIRVWAKTMFLRN